MHNTIENLKKSKNILIALPIGLIIIAAVGTLFYFQSGLFIRPNLTQEKAAEIALDFINQSIEDNVTASLIEATDEGQVYGLHIDISGTEYQSYITKDGKFLFPNGFILSAEQIASYNK